MLTSADRINTILHLLLITPPDPSQEVRFVRNVYSSTMREKCLNALLLHFIHKGIALDYNAIIDDYAKRNQRRMPSISDSLMSGRDWFSVIFGGCNI